jgi:prepilin-type N-terminal cleavage/methylation domain-containing protein
MRLRKAFTIIELLTVLVVLAILVGLLIPAMNMARNAARVAKQKVQLTSIDHALLAWRNDFGDYPPSVFTLTTDDKFYCGAQKLAEAFFGLDLLGFYPDTSWDGVITAYTTPPGDDISKRKQRYLDLDSVDVVTVNNLYGSYGEQLAPDTYVICDVFGWTDVTIGTEHKKVGLPILYYKADPSGTSFKDPGGLNPGEKNVYDWMDNLQLVVTQMNYDENVSNIPADEGHKILNYFYRDTYKILDQKITTKPWPHRPDSYILISAGLDGLYGTSDDITNFGQ